MSPIASSPKTLQIFIHTGEVSGDLQGALLVEALKRQAAARQLPVQISAMGGSRMAQAGAQVVADTMSVSSIGIFEALPHALSALKLQRRAKQHLRQLPPDVVVLIDYMGPNVALGNFVRQRFSQVPIAYFIAPQLWVWAMIPGDTQKILAIADRVLAIFPEEARYYQAQGGKVTWVGHPLIDKFAAYSPDQARRQARQQLEVAADATVVTLLPASRRQELTYIVPTLFEAARLIQQQQPGVEFLVPLARAAFAEPLAAALEQYGLKGRTVPQESQQLAIAAADLALTKSGTANLEIALMDVPQVVMYRLNRLTAWVAEFVLKFSAAYVSPVNLVNMEPVVPEFVQWQATPEAISQAALALLNNPDRRRQMLEGYQAMRRHMGDVGVCDRAANEILTMALDYREQGVNDLQP